MQLKTCLKMTNAIKNTTKFHNATGHKVGWLGFNGTFNTVRVISCLQGRTILWIL